jgi:hypothetical protein
MSACYGAAAAALRSFSNTGACLFEQDERIDMCLIGCDMAFSLVLWLPLSRESRYRFFAARIHLQFARELGKTHPERGETFHEPTR